MSTYTVKARHVRAGSRIADNQQCTVYQGVDLHEAHDVMRWVCAWARESTCGGTVIVDLYLDDTVHDSRYAQCLVGARWVPKSVRPTDGYPPHGCGSPMVPPDVAGVKARDGFLFCVGCHSYSKQPAEVRMRAQVAASTEAGRMTMAEAYRRLPERARRLMMRKSRRALVRSILSADPDWRPRRHVMRGLTGEELAAARESDARTARQVAALRRSTT